MEINITNEAEYRGLPLPSYSLLKKMDDSGPRAINRKQKMDSEAIDFGSLLDCRLLCPEEYDNKFYFKSIEKPTGQLLELADYIVDYCTKDGLAIHDYFKHQLTEVSYLTDKMELFGSVKDPEKRAAKWNNNLFWNYLQAKQDSLGKMVFTPDVEEECLMAEGILRTHVKTAHLFSQQPDEETFNQLMIVANIYGVTVKGMIDKAIVNHRHKTITGYDLKATEYRQVNFPHHFKKMKYYLQGGLYRYLLAYHFSDLIEQGYTLQDFKFIVYSRSDRYPFLWNMGLKWHQKAMEGWDTNDGDHVKGIIELLEEYKFYIENDFYEVDRCIVENECLEL